MYTSNNIILKNAFIESKAVVKKQIGWMYQIHTFLARYNISQSSLQDTSTSKCTGNKLRTYRLVKNETKLDEPLSTHLAKLRLIDHKLNIELGRRSRPPVPL